MRTWDKRKEPGEIKAHLSVTFPPDIAQRARNTAWAEHKTLSSYLAEAIAQHFARLDAEQEK